MAHSVLFLLLLSFLARGLTYTPTEEDFDLHNRFVDALNNNSFALFTLRELFFPSVGPSPLCAPIIYEITCDDYSTRNFSYLWTQYDSQSLVGQILISSAYYGIVLRGFNWEDSCWFFNDSAFLRLSKDEFNCESDAVFTQLKIFTATLKAYAEGGSVSGETINTYRGYAVNWKEEDKHESIFHTSYIILTTVIVVINCFVLFFSMGICFNVYDAIYTDIKCKKNPYYPLFWSAVVISTLWNIGPAWYVLGAHMIHIRITLGIMIPVQLLLATFMKKYVDFPIPCMNWKKLSLHWQGYFHQPKNKGNGSKGKKPGDTKLHKYFFWEICKLRFVARTVVSFIVQTFAVWTLLVLFTFVVFYAVTIAISLYLFPVQTLVKVIFVKAVAVCAVFGVAILFTSKSLVFACNKKAVIINITNVAQFFAVLSFLPLLAFLAYVIGGVLFTASINQLNGVQGVLAILPSAILILIGWFSRGRLFPEEPIAPIHSDLDEESGTGHETSGSSVGMSRPTLADKVKAYMEGNSGYGSMEPRASTSTNSDKAGLVALSSTKAL